MLHCIQHDGLTVFLPNALMGFWDFLFGKPVKIADDFFGEMLFVENAKDATRNYFECRRNFKPADKSIEVIVDGQLSGPTSQQKAFFRWVEDDYTALVAKFIPLIEAEFAAWLKQPVIQNFATEFTISGLSIPTCDQRPIEWEMSFDTVHDLNHMVTIGMRGDEPQYVQIDG